jgi:hypothetical protein
MITMTGPRMTTDREQELAQAMHDALIDVVKGYKEEEIFAALLALVCEVIENDEDPASAAESAVNALKANFLPGTEGSEETTH